ncbi:DnaJ- protein scj1 [Coemansia sp. RSA 1813]|nr:DnaJ- protein scj1 [Coemansia sp. RSA 1646]KAJ1768574.1 DnaJ- protein scj1 [Coemansia sp. RSA 1843]KAJ2088423.1 DnaJ- protein scj1 [Coemansia sp. RSA 986]KAJ2213516.1 DnaJ- protein scj1 [Coemansia sp. RSA 487]KAJ2568939.1 DnaJ- protein scj1 [Coemansia sp. RSA 1813]
MALLLRKTILLTFLAALCVAVCFVEVALAAGKDYYKILGVSRDASTQEIKRQYKTLSRKHHPDKNPGDEKAHERFIELAQAYEVLSDDEKREIYNRYGEEGLKNQGGPGGGGAGFHDPFDIFAQFFGGHVRFDRRGGGRAKPRGPDVHIHVPVTLFELYAGAEIEVDISKQVICPHCDGSGAASPDDIETCSTCSGSGIRIVKQILGPGIVQQMQTTCDACGGKGKKVAKPCPHCKGTRVRRDADVLSIKVDPGMRDSEEIAFEGEADQHPDQEPGSVVVHLRQQPHSTYVRHGDNLHAEVTITLLDALVGFNRTIRHVDGKSDIDLRQKGVTPPGYVQKLSGKGMPRRDQTSARERAGDIHVTYWIQFPRSIDKNEKEALASLFGGWEDSKWDGTTSKTAKGSSSTHSGRQAPPSDPKVHDEL